MALIWPSYIGDPFVYDYVAAVIENTVCESLQCLHRGVPCRGKNRSSTLPGPSGSTTLTYPAGVKIGRVRSPAPLALRSTLPHWFVL